MTVADSSGQVAGPPTVLVVDDDAPLRGLLSRILSEAGFRVIVASDGQQALDALVSDEIQPDLVLTDVIMPHLSGPDFAHRVRSLHPYVPIVFMSGYIGRLSEYGLRMLEEHTLIQKPFSPDELVAKVRGLLEEEGRETG